jgi:hypothetical protein
LIKATSREKPVMQGRAGCAWLSGKRERKNKEEQKEMRHHQEMREREAAQAREADKERKRERARRAKAAGPDAIRKGKYPRCTQ